jgi:hypothetical protein
MNWRILVVNDPNFVFALGILAVALGLLGLLVLLYEVKFKDTKQF